MENNNRAPLWQALGLAWELGYTIAVPLVILALVGRWADQTFHTSPWLLLTGIGLSIMASSLLLVRKFKQIINRIDLTPKA
jgi:F0F1-type ATP synthase assembly protein I